MLPPYPLLLDDHSLAVDEIRLEKGIDERYPGSRYEYRFLVGGGI